MESRSSCASLLSGVDRLQNQPQPSTPNRAVKREQDVEWSDAFSPETSALLKGLGDSPESLQLKASYLQSFNQLRRGFSSGSAGGDVTPAPVPTPSVEPPVTTNPPIPTASPEASVALPTPEPLAVKPEVSMDELKKDMLEKLHSHMKDLEDKMMAELETKKRQAEQELEKHIDAKRQRLQDQVNVLAEERSEQECRLALVSEQLQEKMQCMSEEQAALDELKEKSRMMQEQLNSMPVTPRTEDDHERKTQHKEALKLKLQAAALKTPEQPTQSPVSVHSQHSQPPSSKQPSPTGGASDGSSPIPDGHILVPTSSQRFTSSTHPEAWQYLYRLTKSKDKCDEEIYKAWHEGGPKRDKLLKDFVCRCFNPADDANRNKAKLSALYKLRQKSRQWQKNLKGYAWHTEDEMDTVLKWPKAKIEGAIKLCTQRKMTKKCVYDSNTTKYLVLTKDEVEQGDEKLKELEAELQEMGLYDSEFSLGDIMEEQEDETKTPEPTRKKLPEFPVVEGDETVVEYVGQYKRQCLNKKALLKSTKERLEKDKAVGHESDLAELEKAGSELNLAYLAIGNIEIGPRSREKSAYAKACEDVRVACLRFQNAHAQVKTHFVKSAAKGKAAKKDNKDKEQKGDS